MPLTIQNVRDASPRERLYALYDGHGLCPHVTPYGSKLWRYRYRFGGREKMISLGVFPKVTLPAARRQHADARGLLLRGIDPSAERRAHRAAASRTFEAVARSWLKSLDLLVSKGSLALDTYLDELRSRASERALIAEAAPDAPDHLPWPEVGFHIASPPD